jgi:hypothetical protein
VVAGTGPAPNDGRKPYNEEPDNERTANP